VRQQALTLVEPYWQSLVRGQAEYEVTPLFIQDKLLRDEALERLRANTTLSEPVRREALALAGRYVENPSFLHQLSRALICQPGATPSAYQRALRQAETASRLTPYEEAYPTTLGMAQYRVGKFAAAVDTLTQATQRSNNPGPSDLAVLAMAQCKLGRKDQARAALERVRELIQHPPWAGDAEAQALAHEAEVLLQGQ
jgi:tetratricopeptide (TPR) repeat protein